MSNLTIITVALLTIISTVAVAQPVTNGRKAMVSRKSADVYAVIGEGEIRTVGCTVGAVSMTAVVESKRGKPWIWFIDRDGETEAGCEVDITPKVEIATTPAPVITRGIAVID